MKKLITLLAVVMLAVIPAVARDKVTRDVNVLPAPAREMIKKYFPKVAVNHIKIDSNFLEGHDYDVILNNGDELDFDSKGNLKEVDCGMRAVPDGMILKPIRDYVAQNFKGQKIISLSVERSKYEVELSNGTDLEFDRSGKFRRIDD